MKLTESTISESVNNGPNNPGVLKRFGTLLHQPWFAGVIIGFVVLLNYKFFDPMGMCVG